MPSPFTPLRIWLQIVIMSAEEALDALNHLP